MDELKAYELIESRESQDLNATVYRLKHKKTGAKVVLISNEDDNKVFYVGFRTPPKDSTGVAHILEHSVLCGSKEFPIKDPFVELVKGSLNTFLNAMTYPDKTIYPVASCNEKDFQNLMHVYLDAVFYPRIYQNEMIFRQEGWHYELENAEDELTINGVVYNEMKGAFSSPDDVLERELMNSLYPDNSYGYESGGDPEVIPELTYQDFKDFHGKYYHPSNAYIYLYGNMDMEEKLDFIDKYYLSDFEKIEVDSDIAFQKAFTNTQKTVREYPISEEEKEEENGYLSLNTTVANSLDGELNLAFQIIDYALCSTPGAPLKQALVDRGIGKDVYSIYESGIKQPYFSVVSKNVNVAREEEFLTTIHEVLTETVAKGFSKKALLAGINYYEFKYREADYGRYPKGLMWGLQILDSWLYDEEKPFVHVEANELFVALRQKVEGQYFEQMVQQYLIDNTHKSIVVLVPKKGLTTKKEKKQKEDLQVLKSSMSKEEIAQIVRDTESLTVFQETEDSKEDLAKIPLLTRADLEKEARKIVNEERAIGETKVLYHPIFTNGIGYVRFIFSTENVPADLFPYIGLLKGVFGLLNTENFKYGDLFNEMNILTGGMSAVSNAYENINNEEDCKVTIEIKTKVLYQNIDKAIALIKEILLASDYCDTKRLYEILAEGKSRMQASMSSAGHNVAVGRALSYTRTPGVINEVLSGISFYRLTADIEEHFSEKQEELVGNLKILAAMIFRSENLMVDFVGEEEGYQYLANSIEDLKNSLYTEKVEKGSYRPEVVKKNEGFMTSGQVQYVCRAGNFKKKGLPYKGYLKVLKVMMGYEYLWMNIRVKGGAYGCMCNFGKSGDCYFVSYRDPNLGKTLEIFENAAEVIEHLDVDERTLTQYIIGAVSDLDTPMNPATLGLFSLSAYMTGVTQEMLQSEREEVLQASKEDLRSTSKYLKAFMEEECLCVVGNSDKIKENSSIFTQIENLY